MEEKRLLQGKERFQVTPLAVVECADNDAGRTHGRRIGYLEGLRGFFTIATLLAIFFRVFAPAIQTDTDEAGVFPAAFVQSAPAWQNTLRRAMSPLFWDSTLTPHFFIILTGRVVLQTYIERRAAVPLAGAAFRRPFRLLGPAVFGLTLASVLSATGAFAPGVRMATALNSNLARPARIWTSALEFFNSLVAYFFAEPGFGYFDRAFAFIQPSGVAWVLPIVFQQTYTCITLAYILPYTRLQAKVIGYLGFGLLCYWVGSWAWYSLTGLVICEFATVYAPITPRSFPLRWSRQGRTLFHMPLWLPPLAVMAIGVVQKYVWASYPSGRANEYVAHTDILTAGLIRNLDPARTPFPRIDDWMVITGLLITVEVLPSVQAVLDNVVLKHIGRLSLAITLTSGSVFVSLGGFVRARMVQQLGMTNPATLLAVLFFSCVPAALLAAAAVHWTVDVGTMAAARLLFAWMCKP